MTMTNNSSFTASAVILGGDRIPATYRISSTGNSIRAELDMDGERFALIITKAAPDMFAAAMAAAQGGAADVDGELLAALMADAKPVRARAERVADPAKQRRGDVPEKGFIGQVFTGRGWRIEFDGAYGKTRVIFERKPSAAVIDAVKAAGFYWSPALKSWNKGLTFRAYRAAEQLRATLGTLTA